MVVVSVQPVDDHINIHTDSSQFQTCKSTSDIFTQIPIVDFSDAINAKKVVVEACKEFGFFKVINHGISMEFLAMLEAEALNFFRLPQQEKDKSAPIGYGNKKIGPNGDMGWVEYLLFSTKPEQELITSKPHFPGQPSPTFWFLVGEYVCAVRKMLCVVMEMICEELEIEPRDVLSKMIGGEESDSCFRVNHYPPCPDIPAALSSRNLIGFGEHTDPQIMSVMRSSNTPGLEICLRNGSWVSVPPDQTSFFFNVGDSLQVMSNGRLKSVKHRVVANCLKSRVSMVYFGGPPLSEKIAPLMEGEGEGEEGEESLYEEFTWSEYKKSAYNTKLGDDRLKLYEKSRH